MARIDRFILNAIAHTRMRQFVVVYDFSDDHERKMVSDLLTGYGTRIQYSVFECRLDRRKYEELVSQVNKLVMRTGFLKIYPLDKSGKQLSFGQIPENRIEPDDNCIII